MQNEIVNKSGFFFDLLAVAMISASCGLQISAAVFDFVPAICILAGGIQLIPLWLFITEYAQNQQPKHSYTTDIMTIMNSALFYLFLTYIP